MDKKHDGVWLMVVSEGKRFIGKVCGLSEIFSEEDATVRLEEREYTDEDKLNILMAERIRLSPIFDYVTLDQPFADTESDPKNPRVTMKRQPVVSPFDMSGETAEAWVKASTILFINDQADKVRERYYALIDLGLEVTGEKKPPLVTLVKPGDLSRTR